MFKIRTLADLLADIGLNTNVFLHIPTAANLEGYQGAFVRSGREAIQSENRWQRSRNFQHGRHIVTLIPYDRDDRYFFAGIYDITSDDRPEISTEGNGVYYLVENTPSALLEKWIGKVILKWNRPVRTRYLHAETAAADLEIVAIREAPFGADDIVFPGYHGFHLNRTQFDRLFSVQMPTWKTALSKVAGVYVITDTRQNVSYVGSAYSGPGGNGDGIWGRWMGYFQTKDNGNKLLHRHVVEHGTDNLTYSVLLTMDLRSNKDDVIRMEGFYKEAFGTRVHGLNDN